MSLALVTGAAGGLGLSHAHHLAAAGARVVLTDLDARRAEAVAAEVGHGAMGMALDVRDPAAWARAADAVRGLGQPLRCLVNNAGQVLRADIAATSADDFSAVLSTHLLGTFLGIQALAPLLADAGGGSIVNTGSTAGRVGFAGLAAYSAAKAGVHALTRTAAVELAPGGTRVNTVVPGLVETPMTAGLDRPSASLVGRRARAAEVSALVVWLAGPDSSFCTGAEFVVDGGETSAARQL